MPVKQGKKRAQRGKIVSKATTTAGSAEFAPEEKSHVRRRPPARTARTRPTVARKAARPKAQARRRATARKGAQKAAGRS